MSPVRPLTVIAAKAVPYLLLAFLVLVVILTLSFAVLKVPLSGSLFWIVVVSILYILLALSLGLLISNVAKTQFVALLVSAMVLLLPTVMLSGMLFPVEPVWEQDFLNDLFFLSSWIGRCGGGAGQLPLRVP